MIFVLLIVVIIVFVFVVWYMCNICGGCEYYVIGLDFVVVELYGFKMICWVFSVFVFFGVFVGFVGVFYVVCYGFVSL